MHNLIAFSIVLQIKIGGGGKFNSPPYEIRKKKHLTSKVKFTFRLADRDSGRARHLRGSRIKEPEPTSAMSFSVLQIRAPALKKNVFDQIKDILTNYLTRN